MPVAVTLRVAFCRGLGWSWPPQNLKHGAWRPLARGTVWQADSHDLMYGPGPSPAGTVPGSVQLHGNFRKTTRSWQARLSPSAGSESAESRSKPERNRHGHGPGPIAGVEGDSEEVFQAPNQTRIMTLHLAPAAMPDEV